MIVSPISSITLAEAYVDRLKTEKEIRTFEEGKDDAVVCAAIAAVQDRVTNLKLNGWNMKNSTTVREIASAIFEEPFKTHAERRTWKSALYSYGRFSFLLGALRSINMNVLVKVKSSGS